MVRLPGELPDLHIPNRVLRVPSGVFSYRGVVVAGWTSREREPREEREMLCGPKGSEQNSNSMVQCSVCGRGTEMEELPGRSEKYCLECSADMATSILLVTEIDAATLAGQEAGGLVAEFERLSSRMLERSQSAEA